MHSALKTLVLASWLFLSPFPLLAQSGYDAIVDELTARQHHTRRETTTQAPADLLGDVKIYFGAGWVSSAFQPPQELSKSLIWHSGVVLTMGIDLFSHNWMAEGSIKNFGTASEELHTYKLKDFDLKLVHQSSPFRPVRGKMGLGLGGRFLHHAGPEGSREYSTPYAVATGGLSALLTRHLQISAEVAARTALIQETIDKSSMDVALKIDTFF